MIHDLSAFQPGSPWPLPDKDTRCRWHRYRDCRDAYGSKHPDWLRRVSDPDKLDELKVIVDFHGRLTRSWADMLFGERPTVSHAGDAESAYLHDLMTRTDLLGQCYTAALDVSALGDGLLKLRMDEGAAKVRAQMPEVWVPLVDDDDCTDFEGHVLVIDQTVEVPGRVGKTHVVTIEVHEPGIVTVYDLTATDAVRGTAGKVLSFSERESTPDHPNPAPTGTECPTLLHVPNGSTSASAFGIDDYKVIDPLLDEMTGRYTLNSVVLDKHADPNMAVNEESLEIDPSTGKTVLKVGGATYVIDANGNKPEYVTWDGNLTPSLAQIAAVKEELFLVSETCPAQFGDNKAGATASGSALKRQMMAPLSKVNRLRIQWDTTVKAAIRALADMETFYRVKGAVLLPDPAIEWRDGLPEDETEVTASLVTRYTAGLLSLETALRRQGFQGDVNDETTPLGAEYTRIMAEKPAVPTGGAPRITLQTFNNRAGA